jgi:hypothetical protein
VVGSTDLERNGFVQPPDFIASGENLYVVDIINKSSKRVYVSRPELAAAYFGGLVALYTKTYSDIRVKHMKLKPIFSVVAKPFAYNQNEKRPIILRGNGLVNVATAYHQTFIPSLMSIKRDTFQDISNNSNQQHIIYVQEF